MRSLRPILYAILTLGLGPTVARSDPPPPADRNLPRYTPTTEDIRKAYERTGQPAGGRRGSGSAGLYKAQIAPHWFRNNARFWYRNDLRNGTKEFVVVDVERGTRDRAFDHAKLAAELAKALGTDVRPERLPFDAIEFVDDDRAIRFGVANVAWVCDLTTYACSRSGGKPPAPAPQPNRPEPLAAGETDDADDWQSPWSGGDGEMPSPQQPQAGRRRPGGPPPSPKSPDGKWTALVKDHNVWVRSDDGQEVQLSEDGKEGLAYGLLQWAPDSKTLVAFRVEPGDRTEVYLIESSPQGGGRAKLQTRPYPLPGDKFASYELNLFAVHDRKQTKPQVERIDFGTPRPRWRKDGRRFTYQKVDRGHQRFRVIEVDAGTGTSRTVVDEKAATFVWTAHTENVTLGMVNYLDDSDEIVWASEKDGWRHLYLVDAREGRAKNAITQGPWVVRGIDRIDEAGRQIWFRASGKYADQDPYFVHHYRVNFDGTGLVALTAANGNHTVQFSPDRQYLIDTYSRVDLPPVHELRRTDDGTLVCELEKADVSELKARGWEPPEVFVAKGRDGTTDIWGVIARPRNLDPTKRYPVIEQIYAGPQGSFVPKSFSAGNRYAAFTDLGFIVVQVDGMGTANRSKAFHDVCWKNLKDAGFPDRILWHRAVGAKYPYYDLSRVGITGGSAGGQNAAGGVLFHPEFYKAAVAGCGCHDNRMDKASWNEQWMGYPVGSHYAESSNADNAHRLRGKLLLIVGEMDTNVPPESTLRVVDALIKANKDFEMLVVPGAGHGMGGAYGSRRQRDFFVRHLHGVEPPDRNAPPRPGDAAAADAKPAEALPAITAPPDSFFEKYAERDREAARAFYKKYLDVTGVSVAAAGPVADEALLRTHHIVTRMLAGRPDVLQTMAKRGTRLIIIGKDQVYTDMPEYRNHPNPVFMNERVRGTGGLGVTSFGEENLLNLPTDRYDDESIGVHEFCHTIDAALSRLDSTWQERLNKTYADAVAKGLWKNTYAASNSAEYWAEIAQSYFDCNRVNNWNHGPIGTREQLKRYDPDGYELVRSTFNLKPADDWRYAPVRRQPSVMPPPAAYAADPHYTKFTLAREFPIFGSRQVSDAALLRANDAVRKMFAYRHDILKAMIADGGRLVVLGPAEKLSGLPEFKNARDTAGFDATRYLDYAADRKLMVVPEDAVFARSDDSHAATVSVVGLFARGLHVVTAGRPVDPQFDKRHDKQQYELRVKRLDVGFDARLKALFEAATGKGMWKGTPAARDRVEYWAAGVEAYFDAGCGRMPTSTGRAIATREALESYDPELHQLVEETMAYAGRADWRVPR